MHPNMVVQTAKYSGHTSRASMAKRRIMDTAAQLFAKRGYGNVGVHEVGATAGFGKGALYYHIRSKEDLLFSIIMEQVGRLVTSAHAAIETTQGTPARIDALTNSFVELLLGNAPSMTVCFRDVHALCEPENIQNVADMHAAYREIWSDMLRQGTAAGEHRPIPEIEVNAFLAMYFGSVFWVQPEFIEDQSAITETLSRTVKNTVMTADQ